MILGAGTATTASAAVFGVGLLVIVPQLREEYELSLAHLVGAAYAPTF